MILFFTNDEIPPSEGAVAQPCGTRITYKLVPPEPAPQGTAYLNRAVAEANTVGTFNECVTDFVYEVNGTTFALEKGDLDVEFDLGCDLVAGVIQPGPLTSVRVALMATIGDDPEKKISEGIVRLGLTDSVCMQGDRINVESTLTIKDNETVVAHQDKLTIRIELRAVNTEKDLEPYWFLDTNPNANVEFNITDPEDVPECSDTLDNDGDNLIDHPNDTGCTDPEDDDETDGGDDDPQCSDGQDNDGDNKIDHGQDPGCTSPEDDDETDEGTDPTECSDTIDNDGDNKIDHGQDPGCTSPEDNDEDDNTQPTGDAPNCARDDPPEGEIVRRIGEAFTLTAVCTDPDDDLETAEWTVDDQPHADDELGPSPAEVDEEFTFDTTGSHVIEVTPTDEAGQDGGPASWVVHIVDDSNNGDAPSCTRETPSQFDVTKGKDESFTLTARCTDPDNDLDKGNWVVDDEPAAEDELGASPATADEEFQFDECGTHHIHFVPRDEAGNVGSAATWRVTVNGCAEPTPTTSSPPPTQTTPIPVFPSSLAFVLAAAGGLGGGFVILRRRGA